MREFLGQLFAHIGILVLPKKVAVLKGGVILDGVISCVEDLLAINTMISSSRWKGAA